MTTRSVTLSLLIVLLATAPRLSADTHRFTPERFYNTYSFAHPPALRIKPGDRVVTTTLDASGVDAQGRQAGQGPNPQTGPFFVEGAEPGDLLMVTFEKIETNRATITLPLRPMLGCVAVAPARKEAIATPTPGAFGGNLDYAGVTSGVTVMLPVNEPGALLFIGDGHARQGEGEVVGTGLETSMDVEFTVQLVKQKAASWPRMDTATHVMVLGSARPLLQALQHATSEMLRWLVADYGFSERGASVFMGQALEYEIANVVDPNFTVVAKVRKALLPPR